MTDKEILQKALEKAYKGGLNNIPEYLDYIDEWWSNTRLVNNEQMPTLVIRSIIFSHSFAEAFWNNCDCSDQQVLSYEDPTRKLKHFQYHLQQMVLDENPLKYLEKFI